MGLVFACKTMVHLLLVLAPRATTAWWTTSTLLRTGGVHSITRRRAHANTNGPNETIYTIKCPPTDPEKLKAVVRKHVTHLDRFLYSKPIAAHTRASFSLVQDRLYEKQVILDSGCGTGRSSLLLGEQNSNCNVIGVDRSFVRLGKNRQISSNDFDEAYVQQVSENVWLVRADLVDFWRCCLQAQDMIHIAEHYLLYPNPYPKPARLQSRWYGHPSFPLLLSLGQEKIVVRSNWELYLKEFAESIVVADAVLNENKQLGTNYARPFVPSLQLGPRRREPISPQTNFEEKYDRVGEATFELVLERSGTRED